MSFASAGVTVFPAVRPNDAGGFESIGAHGCFLSHLGVLRATAGLDSVLILEDDVDFAEGFRLPEIPSDWGMFYGGARHEITPAGRVTAAHHDEPIVCAHFLAVRGPVIPRLVAYLEAILSRPPGHPDGGPMHVDGAYQRFRSENPDARTYVATPELGRQRSSRTDIHALRWFDRVPVVRALAGFARRARRWPVRRWPGAAGAAALLALLFCIDTNDPPEDPPL